MTRKNEAEGGAETLVGPVEEQVKRASGAELPYRDTELPFSPAFASGDGLRSVTRSGEQSFDPSPLETLRSEEVQRTRYFIFVAIAMAIVIGGSLFVIEGEPLARRLLVSGLVVIVVSCAALLLAMRRPDGYTPARALFVGFCAVYGAFTGIHFFGPFSPAPIIIPFGVFFFSLSQGFWGTFSVYVTCSVGLLVLFVADATGASHGLVQAPNLSFVERSMIVGLVEVIVLGTFVIGRASRTTTLRAIEEHSSVVRNLAQRNALLQEARQELERALHAGGMGRYSDQTLGSFKLKHVLGRGAMGEVYAAESIEDGTIAAVKVLRIETLAHTESLRRFVREAEIAASLKCENIVRVLEIGRLDAQIPYIAMELLEGTDLGDHLLQKGRLSVEDTVRLAREVARGLGAAREAGIVHRDLKPANLFFARGESGDRSWKIVDFGVSKLAGTTEGTLTRDKAIVGTPDYMSPEQASSGLIDHRTDVHALGAICYRALTGVPPFSGDNVLEVLYQVVHSMPVRPSVVLDALGAPIDAVLHIAMAKDPERRFTTAEAFAEALGRGASGELDAELAARASILAQSHPWLDRVGGSKRTAGR